MDGKKLKKREKIARRTFKFIEKVRAGKGCLGGWGAFAYIRRFFFACVERERGWGRNGARIIHSGGRGYHNRSAPAFTFAWSRERGEKSLFCCFFCRCCLCHFPASFGLGGVGVQRGFFFSLSRLTPRRCWWIRPFANIAVFCAAR